MIAELLSHLLLTSSVLRIVPVDATSLEWAAGVGEASTFFMFPSTNAFATLPRAADRIVAPKKIDLDSYGIVTNARSAIVVDATSGAVLFSKRPDDIRAIGSITKLMAVYTFLQTNPSINNKVTILPDDYVGGGRVYVRFDDPLYIYDVLKAALVGSDNTATESLARLSGMSDEDFVVKMNENAGALGMTSSYFADLTGVDVHSVSTPRDLTKMLAAAELNPTMAGIMPMSTVTIAQASGYSVVIDATNELLQSYLNSDTYHVVAGKTGFIPQAGYCLATAVEHDGHRIRVVVLGSDTKVGRFTDAKGLAGWAYKTFSWK